MSRIKLAERSSNSERISDSTRIKETTTLGCNRIRVRETGASLPNADPIASESGSFFNSGTVGNTFGIATPLGQFDPRHGWSQPNSLYVVGADITLNPKKIGRAHV